MADRLVGVDTSDYLLPVEVLTALSESSTVREGVLDSTRRAALDRVGLFDPARARGSYVTQFLPSQEKVMQAVFVDEGTGEIFVTQAGVDSGTITGRESTTISHLSAAGVFLDQMVLEDAGHGTVLVVEWDQGVRYVWSTYFTYAPGSDTVTARDMVRVPYLPGETIQRTDARIELVPDFTTDYSKMAVDLQAGRVVSSARVGANAEEYRLRDIADVKAGRDLPIGSAISIPDMTVKPLQGFTTLDDWFVYLWGMSDEAQGIDFYSWATGELVHTLDIQWAGLEADGTRWGGFAEPEGVSTYRDAAGNPSLVFGMSTGPTGRRRHKLLAYSLGTIDDLTRGARQTGRQALSMPDLSMKRLDPNTTLLNDCKDPGWYYISTAEFGQLTDRPSTAPTSSAYVLFNSARTSDGTTMQQLTIVHGTDMTTYVRRSKTPSDRTQWWQVGMTAVSY